MPDLLTNFAHTKTTAGITAADTVVPVNELSRIPSNALLAANDYFMTFESTLTANTFEVVRVVSKSAETGAGTLTVVRSQEGTLAVSRASGAILKGAITAGVLSRVGLRPRQSSTYTTASLAANARESGLVTMGLAYRLYVIQTTVQARVRLYTTVAGRDADATRGIGVDPAINSGLMLDYVTSGASPEALSPVVDGFDGEATPDTSIAITVDNLSGATAAVGVTLTYVRTE